MLPIPESIILHLQFTNKKAAEIINRKNSDFINFRVVSARYKNHTNKQIIDKLLKSLQIMKTLMLFFQNKWPSLMKDRSLKNQSLGL